MLHRFLIQHVTAAVRRSKPVIGGVLERKLYALQASNKLTNWVGSFLVGTAVVALALLTFLLANESSAAPQESKERLLETVLSASGDGIPWNQCERLESFAEDLRRILRGGPGKYQGNAVVCLGVLGDPRSKESLTVFLESGTGKVGEEEYLAKISVLWALGAIANQSEDDSVREYLERGTNLTYWAQKVRWQGPSKIQPVDLQTQLARSSMQALGLAATPKALEYLNTFDCHGASPCPLNDVLHDARETCRQINELAKNANILDRRKLLREYFAADQQ